MRNQAMQITPEARLAKASVHQLRTLVRTHTLTERDANRLLDRIELALSVYDDGGPTLPGGGSPLVLIPGGKS
jgi:hypothetical protein